MELVVQLMLAIAVFGVTISGGSLVWPRVTRAPRPQILQQVRDTVVKTPIGASAAKVLGVSDDKTVVPVSLKQISDAVLSEITRAAQKRAQAILMSQVTAQLASQYEKLPKDQQEQLREIICTSSPSGVVK